MGVELLMRYSIGMMISILSKISKYVLRLVLIATFIVIVFFMLDESEIGNDYQYISNRSDDLHITKNNKIIVGSTIVDFDIVSSFVVGLRLPASYLSCENDDAFKIIIENTHKYFILSIDTDELLNYSLKNEFKDKLVELNLKDKLTLDYSKFDKVWKKYSKYYEHIDFTSCKLE